MSSGTVICIYTFVILTCLFLCINVIWRIGCMNSVATIFSLWHVSAIDMFCWCICWCVCYVAFRLHRFELVDVCQCYSFKPTLGICEYLNFVRVMWAAMLKTNISRCWPMQNDVSQNAPLVCMCKTWMYPRLFFFCMKMRTKLAVYRNYKIFNSNY